MIMNMARRDDEDYDAPQSFSAISPTRCAELLSTQSVGRVAWQGPHGLQILPVTYVYYEGSIVFRTAVNSVLSDLTSSTDVVFEIDEIDQRNHRGWSVVASGRAEAVDEQQEVNRLLTDAGVVPWAPGPRNVLIQITPQKVTGRTVAAR
jgi:nitroimidazol reductase NimA-like FMN-containing flavoprotein (pyridoxamine 5'-phosphate oxidase superfamily)